MVKLELRGILGRTEDVVLLEQRGPVEPQDHQETLALQGVLEQLEPQDPRVTQEAQVSLVR